jgi:hypothetical protein
MRVLAQIWRPYASDLSDRQWDRRLLFMSFHGRYAALLNGVAGQPRGMWFVRRGVESPISHSMRPMHGQSRTMPVVALP